MNAPGRSRSSRAAGAAGFGEALAAQVGQYGVSVFTVGPGLVKTAMTARLGYPDDAPWAAPTLAAQLVRVSVRAPGR